VVAGELASRDAGTSVSFKLMEERYHLPLPFPNPLASVELTRAESKGGLNQDRLKVMLFIVTSRRRRIRSVRASGHSPEDRFRLELQR
jgi:hypothetical protein